MGILVESNSGERDFISQRVIKAFLCLVIKVSFVRTQYSSLCVNVAELLLRDFKVDNLIAGTSGNTDDLVSRVRHSNEKG